MRTIPEAAGEGDEMSKFHVGSGTEKGHWGKIMPREAQTSLNEPILPSSESDKKDCLLSVINLL